MVETINPSILVKARKKYEDSTKWFIMNSWDHWFWERITPEEKLMIEKCIDEKWTIQKGELHKHGVYKYDGRIYSFRNKIGLNEFCNKYDLYPDD